MPIELIRVAGDSFLMGSTQAEIEACVDYWWPQLASGPYDRSSFERWIKKEFPAFRIPIASFSIARFPTTNVEYREFVRATGARIPPSFVEGVFRKDHPVWGVTFDEAESYARWLSREQNGNFRLPTEPEWEYAARGQSRNEYPWGPGFLPNACNTLESGLGTTTDVRQFEDYASCFGLCDMAGNVEEWTSSDYAPYPGGVRIDDDLSRLHGNSYKIMRGGSCARNGDLARGARRHGPFDGDLFRFKGFRLAAD